MLLFKRKFIGICLLLSISPHLGNTWGFFAHKEINRLAVFTLPPEMIGFYKLHINYLIERSVQPDKRRYAIKEEGCRHFIDLDAYNDSLRFNMPKYWHDATAIFPEDTLFSHGIVPWHIYLMKIGLTNAFKKNNSNAILKLSAEIGHYIGDAHVPLHTTRNYNGQFTNQHGIHGFWESRLPELFSENYDFFVGKAEYLEDVQSKIWKSVWESHRALDSVFLFEKELSESFPSDKKYGHEERNGKLVKVYSKAYSEKYHQKLNDQVERRLRQSIKMLGDVWYTCWVDAGQPDLNKLDNHSIKDNEEEIKVPGDIPLSDGCSE